MPTHVPTLLPLTVSRLMAGKYIESTPRWLKPMLDNPPVNVNYSIKPSSLSKLEFPEDKYRARFYKDFPHEAARPVDLSRSNQSTSEHMSPNPFPEDCIQHAAKLERRGLSPSEAYARSVQEFIKLRHIHLTSTRYAAQELEYYGHDFGPTEIERQFEKQGEALKLYEKGAEESLRMNENVLKVSTPIKPEWTRGKNYHPNQRYENASSTKSTGSSAAAAKAASKSEAKNSPQNDRDESRSKDPFNLLGLN